MLLKQKNIWSMKLNKTLQESENHALIEIVPTEYNADKRLGLKIHLNVLKMKLKFPFRCQTIHVAHFKLNLKNIYK